MTDSTYQLGNNERELLLCLHGWEYVGHNGKLDGDEPRVRCITPVPEYLIRHSIDLSAFDQDFYSGLRCLEKLGLIEDEGKGMRQIGCHDCTWRPSDRYILGETTINIEERRLDLWAGGTARDDFGDEPDETINLDDLQWWTLTAAGLVEARRLLYGDELEDDKAGPVVPFLDLVSRRWPEELPDTVERWIYNRQHKGVKFTIEELVSLSGRSKSLLYSKIGKWAKVRRALMAALSPDDVPLGHVDLDEDGGVSIDGTHHDKQPE